jgi:hypothetical protein
VLHPEKQCTIHPRTCRVEAPDELTRLLISVIERGNADLP